MSKDKSHGIKSLCSCIGSDTSSEKLDSDEEHENLNIESIETRSICSIKINTDDDSDSIEDKSPEDEYEYETLLSDQNEAVIIQFNNDPSGNLQFVIKEKNKDTFLNIEDNELQQNSYKKLVDKERKHQNEIEELTRNTDHSDKIISDLIKNLEFQKERCKQFQESAFESKEEQIKTYKAFTAAENIIEELRISIENLNREKVLLQEEIYKYDKNKSDEIINLEFEVLKYKNYYEDALKYSKQVKYLSNDNNFLKQELVVHENEIKKYKYEIEELKNKILENQNNHKLLQGQYAVLKDLCNKTVKEKEMLENNLSEMHKQLKASRHECMKIQDSYQDLQKVIQTQKSSPDDGKKDAAVYQELLKAYDQIFNLERQLSLTSSPPSEVNKMCTKLEQYEKKYRELKKLFKLLAEKNFDTPNIKTTGQIYTGGKNQDELISPTISDTLSTKSHISKTYKDDIETERGFFLAEKCRKLEAENQTLKHRIATAIKYTHVTTKI